MKRIALISLGAVLLGLSALSAPASGQNWPCAEDAKKLCKDVPAGGGRVVKCLQGHETELSEACKKHLEPGKAKGPGRRAAGIGACKSDIEKFCKDSKPGGGRIMKCLKEHEADLSAECKAQTAK